MESEISQLPIHAHQQQILAKIKENRVLVLSGKTGCGKSTQVPKFIFQQFPLAKIAICQPRRLAATSLAYRVSEQMNEELGSTVGYHIGMDNKSSEKTQIKFMTYGIFIQELLFKKNITYSHIILDEVHERSLEMDFVFIALKKLLDSQDHESKKLIIMSATINSAGFIKYFSTNKETGGFIRPKITYQQSYSGRDGTRFRGSRQISAPKKLKLNALIQITEGIPCGSIDLPDENKFKITQFFLEEVDFGRQINLPHYYMDDDLRISESTYQLTAAITKMFLNKKEEGDILIFVPGMQQIKNLKALLLREQISQEKNIIEVHSAYSEELQNLLFVQKISNKIIIATNIGQSSITLPYCKIVIDFCLTRKNISVKLKDYSRYETRLASKASLLQRSGRVGRTSDGEVYRLITRKQHSELTDFQIPEIKCVKLEMAILRTKQIDFYSKSKFFEDPYEVFLNAIEPPEISAIHDALEVLVEQEALLYKDTQQKKDICKYRGQNLQLSSIGRFMVSMPCTLKTSKLILFSLQIGITDIILSIAAILMSPKKFFVHEEKIINIEDFMHNMVDYDGGRFNDFYLRHKIFTDWKKQFFHPFQEEQKRISKEKNIQEISNQEAVFIEQPEIDAVLEQFCSRSYDQNERNWCFSRGTSPIVFREILKIYQSLKVRLAKINIIINDPTSDVQNELVLLCLSYIFKNVIYDIEWNSNKKQGNPTKNYIDLVLRDDFCDLSDIEDYSRIKHPEIKIEQKAGGSLRVFGPPSLIAKFLLPKFYTKANKEKTTPKFKYIASSEFKAVYRFKSEVSKSGRAITVLNQTINKAGVKIDPNKQYSLIGEKVFESKGRYFLADSAMIEVGLLTLIKVLTTKSFLLIIHPSRLFVQRIQFCQSDEVQLPFLLGSKQLKEICLIRKFQFWQPNHKIQLNIDRSNKQKNSFLKLFQNLKKKPVLQKWNKFYDKKRYTQKSIVVPIDTIPNQLFSEIEGPETYFEEYKTWKKNYYTDLYQSYRALSTTDICLICSQCFKQFNRMSSIDGIFAFSIENQILDLNEYRGNWLIQKQQLLCPKSHHIGVILDQNSASLEFQQILLYGPYNHVIPFTGKQEQIETMKEEAKKGIQKLIEERQKLQDFQCLICQSEWQQCIIQKKCPEETQNFWKKVQSHMSSSFHMQNSRTFLQGIGEV